MAKTLLLAGICLLGLLARSEGISCMRGWAKHGPYCYKVFDERLPFFVAAKACEMKTWGRPGPRSRIATIYAADQTKFVQFHMGYKAQGYWIGVLDRNLDGQYKYFDRSPLVGYAPWNDGEPNNYGGREHCVMMYGSTGKWNDYGCENKLPFVCRIGY